MILAVANTKGGVGKTTPAFLLAVARARAGRDVWLVDADPQGSASTAATVRTDAGREPVLACSAYPDARALGIQLRRQAGKYEDVIIHEGGRDTEALRVSLVLADTVLVPVQPRGLDVWALGNIAGLIEGARETRDRLSALACSISPTRASVPITSTQPRRSPISQRCATGTTQGVRQCGSARTGN